MCCNGRNHLLSTLTTMFSLERCQVIRLGGCKLKPTTCVSTQSNLPPITYQLSGENVMSQRLKTQVFALLRDSVKSLRLQLCTISSPFSFAHRTKPQEKAGKGVGERGKGSARGKPVGGGGMPAFCWIFVSLRPEGLSPRYPLCNNLSERNRRT